MRRAEAMASFCEKGKIAIVGSGHIGRQWAVLFGSAGFTVQMYDVDSSVLHQALPAIKQTLCSMKQKGVFRGSLEVETICNHIFVTSSLKHAVANSIHIQECVYESPEAKIDIFKQIDELLDNDTTVVSSSTSCIMPSVFTEGLKHKSQCLVSHPVNPPTLLRLVEVVPTSETSEDILERTVELMKLIGQKPVRLRKEADGFLLNRIQYAILAESWRLIQDGVTTCEDIDTVMTEGLGPRYAFIGQMEICNMNAPKGVRDYAERYNGGYLRVMDTFGSTPSWSGELLDKVEQQMNSWQPPENRADRMKYRDDSLAELARLKLKQD